MKGNSIALKTFSRVAQTVPAYQRLLKRVRITPKGIRTTEDFKNLPIIDKKTYIYRNPFEDLFPHGKIPAMAYASSGSTGIPTFWFRGDEQEKMGRDIHERIFRDIFQIKKQERTLVVICFAMGVWIAGNYTLTSCRSIAKRGYNITTITPGIDQEDILQILERLAPNFENLVLAGYPPFLMDVIIESQRRKMKLKNRIFILTAGDKFSEKWRTDFLTLLGIRDLYHSAINIYGSADAGILGHETPLSIFLRSKASENRKFSEELFGTYLDMPGLVQYNPKTVFFEEIRGELVLTANTATPLIRYNIHDLGQILSYAEATSLLRRYSLEKEARQYGLSKWKLPFLILQGRTDVAATFYALNIPPEHIRAGVENRRLAKFLSGSFFVYNKTKGRSKKQTLNVELELNSGVCPDKQIQALSRESILKSLLKWNMEFRKLFSTIGSKALPRVILRPYAHPAFRNASKKKGLANIKGKKPRIVL